MGPSQVRANSRPKQATGRPRARLCLLKGCEKLFKPASPQARYCSGSCQSEAACWRAWKAQEQYRQTEASRACRREQSRRRRKRLAEQKRRLETAGQPWRPAAWVIAQQEIFVLLRPARLLRDVRAHTSLASAAILLAALPACPRAGLGTRAAVAKAMDCAQPRPATTAASVSGAYCS